MDFIKSAATILQDAHLVQKFQAFCGLERLGNNSSRVARTPPSMSDSQHRHSQTFLKGDKGIDAIFSAVDRDSRFISQDELVNRHINHIKEHAGPGGAPEHDNDSSPRSNGAGRIVPGSTSRNSSSTSRGENSRADAERDDAISHAESSSPDYVIHSKFLYYLFRFGSSLGYEAFYATFFPIWTWNIDGAVCR